MTQTLSADTSAVRRKKSAAFHSAEFFYRNNRAMLRINFICNLLGFPALLIYTLSIIPKGISRNMEDDLTAIAAAPVLFQCAAVLMGIFAVLSAFRSSYNKQYVDMDLSLPMSAGERFISSYFGGLAVYILPYLAVQVISLIIYGIGALLYEGRTIGGIDPVTGFDNSRVCTLFSDNLSLCVNLIIGGFFVMVMFYTVWVLVTVCCGNIVSILLSGAAVNVGVPMIFLLTIDNIIRNVYGIDTDGHIYDVFKATSPFGAVFGLFTVAGGRDSLLPGEYFYGDSMTFIPWLTSVAAVTAVIFAVSGLLYGRRSAEQTGKPFAFGIFYEVIIAASLYVAAMIMIYTFIIDLNYSVNSILSSFVVTFAFYVLAEYFSKKGTGKKFRFLISTVKYAATSAAIIGIIMGMSATGCFGKAFYIPKSSQISSVDISTSNMPTYYYYNIGDIHIEDQSGIEAVTSLHDCEIARYKAFLSEKVTNIFESPSYINGEGNIRITYNLTNGSQVSRTYRPAKEGLIEEAKLITPVGIREYCAKKISEELHSYTEPEVSNAERLEFMRSFLKDTYPEEFESLTVMNTLVRSSEKYRKSSLPGNFAEKLSACYTEDMMSLSDEEFLRPPVPKYCSLRFPVFGKENGRVTYKVCQITVRGDYERTIAYLEENGIVPPDNTACETYEEAVKKYRDMNVRVYYAGSENGKPVICGNSYLYLPVPVGNSDAKTAVRTEYAVPLINIMNESNYREITEMIENSISPYISEKSCYIINTGDDSLYVPDKYTETAEYLENTVNEYMHSENAKNIYA